jgi:hypothetical protein
MWVSACSCQPIWAIIDRGQEKVSASAFCDVHALTHARPGILAYIDLSKTTQDRPEPDGLRPSLVELCF